MASGPPSPPFLLPPSLPVHPPLLLPPLSGCTPTMLIKCVWERERDPAKLSYIQSWEPHRFWGHFWEIQYLRACSWCCKWEKPPYIGGIMWRLILVHDTNRRVEPVLLWISYYVVQQFPGRKASTGKTTRLHVDITTECLKAGNIKHCKKNWFCFSFWF